MNIFECIPRDLKAIPRWVLWKYTQRPDGAMGKIPQGPNGNASAHDPKIWMTYEDAVKALQKRLASARWPQGGGIGFVFTDDDDIGGVDLDGCRDPKTGQLAAWAKRVIDVFDGAYVEASPSGTGFHIITRGAPSSLARTERSIEVAEDDLTLEGKGAVLEAYVTKRFFTMTGDHLTGRLELVVRREAWAQVDAFLRGEQSRQDRDEQARHEGREAEPIGDADMDDVRAALAAFGSEDVDRNTWIAIGMALKAEFGEEGRAIWKEWMGRSAHDDADANDKTWMGLPDRPHSVGLGTIYWYAKQHGWKPPRPKGGADAGDGVAAVLAGIIDGVEL